MVKGLSQFKAVVIGGSAGGREALVELLGQLPEDFPLGIAVVLHMHPHSEATDLAISLARKCKLPVHEAAEKELLLPGHIYLAPANYHLLLEMDGRFSLSIDDKVNYSRPSIDVLFQSAAEALRGKLIGVLLSGASSDGSEGLARIKQLGGATLVQNLETASSPFMPRSAIELGVADQILAPVELGRSLVVLTAGER